MAKPDDVADAGVELPPELLAHMEEHSRSFLLSLRRDGSPTAHPMTALVADGRLRFNTYRKSAKARNVERDPRMGVVLVNGYEASAEKVGGFSVEGLAGITQVEALTERRGGGPAISETVKERVSARLEAGKRVMLDLAPRRVRRVGSEG